MLEKAMRLCEAAFGVMHTYDGKAVHPVALRGMPPPFAEFASNPADQPGPGGATPRLMRSERIVHVIDLKKEEAYRSGDPYRRALVDLGGARTLLAVPLRKDGTSVGQIAVYRQEVRPYTEKQIVLLENFAAQAVIAMENARLFGDLRERTADLQEALEHQTATSDVLGVISRSGGELGVVFQTLVATAARICEADTAAVTRLQEGRFRLAAAFRRIGRVEHFAHHHPLAPERGTVTGRIALEGTGRPRRGRRGRSRYTLPEAQQIGGFRTALGVPLMQEGHPIGVIALGRFRVEPFTDKQIALLQNFAAQAVIAMENARLITETREALEQQTATAEVLQIINASPGDLAPVFDAIVEKAMSLCDAAFGSLQL